MIAGRMQRMGAILTLTGLLMSMLAQAQKRKDAEYYFSQGEFALENNKNTTALAHFNECIRLDPYFWEAYHSRASAKERLGDSKGALTDYSIYLESKPAQPEALLSRAVLRYELGQYTTARQDFSILLKLPSGETNAIFFRQDNTGSGTDQSSRCRAPIML